MQYATEAVFKPLAQPLKAAEKISAITVSNLTAMLSVQVVEFAPSQVGAICGASSEVQSG